MSNGNGNLMLFNVASLTAIVGVAVWAGSLQADMERKVEESEFARVEQALSDTRDDVDMIRDDIKELRKEISEGQQRILDALVE